MSSFNEDTFVCVEALFLNDITVTYHGGPDNLTQYGVYFRRPRLWLLSHSPVFAGSLSEKNAYDGVERMKVLLRHLKKITFVCFPNPGLADDSGSVTFKLFIMSPGATAANELARWVVADVVNQSNFSKYAEVVEGFRDVHLYVGRFEDQFVLRVGTDPPHTGKGYYQEFMWSIENDIRCDPHYSSDRAGIMLWLHPGRSNWRHSTSGSCEPKKMQHVDQIAGLIASGISDERTTDLRRFGLSLAFGRVDNKAHFLAMLGKTPQPDTDTPIEGERMKRMGTLGKDNETRSDYRKDFLTQEEKPRQRSRGLKNSRDDVADCVGDSLQSYDGNSPRGRSKSEKLEYSEDQNRGSERFEKREPGNDIKMIVGMRGAVVMSDVFLCEFGTKEGFRVVVDFEVEAGSDMETTLAIERVVIMSIIRDEHEMREDLSVATDIEAAASEIIGMTIDIKKA